MASSEATLSLNGGERIVIVRGFIVVRGTVQGGGIVRYGRDVIGDSNKEVVRDFGAEGGGRFRPSSKVLSQEGSRGVAQPP